MGDELKVKKPWILIKRTGGYKLSLKALMPRPEGMPGDPGTWVQDPIGVQEMTVAGRSDQRWRSWGRGGDRGGHDRSGDRPAIEVVRRQEKGTKARTT